MGKKYNYKTRTLLNVFAIASILLFINPVMTLLPKFILIFSITVWFFLAYLYDQKIMTRVVFSKSIIWACIYVIVIIGNFFLGRASINAHDILLIPIIAMSLYYLELKDFIFLRNALWISVIYYVLISCYSLIRFAAMPSLARVLASGSDLVYREYGNSFTATYSTVYSLVGLVPLVFVFGKMHKKNIISVPIGLFGLFVILRCQYTIGLILAMGFSAIYFMTYSETEKYKWRWIVVVVIAIISLEYASEIVVFVIQHINAETVKRRLSELLLIIQNKGLMEEGDFTNRMKYLMESFNAFRRNPLFGVGYRRDYFMKIIGGHSTFFDIFGKYGIIGGIPYMGTFYSLYISYFKDIDQKHKIIFLIIMLQYTLLNVLNISENVGVYISYYCLIPLVVMYESKYSLIPIKLNYNGGKSP